MNTISTAKVLSSVGGVALVAALVGAPSVALAQTPGGGEPTQVRPTESIAACEIVDATLSWGTIERWRSYIQGSIAQGGWSEDGNVRYEMPNFVWTEGTGIAAVNGEAGTVNFEGTVQFSGHDDLLKVDVSNPTLELVDAEEAYLLLDLSSTKQDGTQDTSETQVRAVKLDIAGTATGGGETVTFADVAGNLTAEGAAAFGGFYSAGEAADPLTVELTAANGCEFIVAEADTPEAEAPGTETPEAKTPESEAPESGDAEAAETQPGAENTSEFPWVPVIIGGVAILVIVGAGAMLIAGRGKNQA